MKIPIIKKGEYDIWSMRMRQYICHTDHNLWDIIVNGDLEDEATPSGEQSSPPVPKTAKQLAARRNQERIKSILLLAIPNEYLLKFHNVPDAKSLWAAIKSRFGGNEESKKMQKNVLKHHEDINQKFLRSLPPSWSQIALIMRNKPDIDEIDIDDLYNNLRMDGDDLDGIGSLIEGGYVDGRVKSSLEERKKIWTSKRKNNMFLLDSQRLSVQLSNAPTTESSSQALVAQDGLGGNPEILKDNGPTQEYILLPLQPHRTGLNTPNVSAASPSTEQRHKDLRTVLFACFLLKKEPKTISHAFKVESWLKQSARGMLQFKFTNRLVAQGIDKKKEIDCDGGFLYLFSTIRGYQMVVCIENTIHVWLPDVFDCFKARASCLLSVPCARKLSQIVIMLEPFLDREYPTTGGCHNFLVDDFIFGSARKQTIRGKNSTTEGRIFNSGSLQVNSGRLLVNSVDFKLILGGAVWIRTSTVTRECLLVKLVKKVKSLETTLKRKSKKVLISELEESMKEKSTDFVTHIKASGEAHEEEGVSKEKSTDKGKRYRRRARSMAKKIDTGLDAEEEINTGRELQWLKRIIQGFSGTKEQMRQEQAGLEEAIKLQAQLDEEVAKQIHLDKMVAKRMTEEEALSEQKKKRKAQVQF
ncbi:hypothetical protein Tco_1483899 [Tanacetum coccineum]